MRTVDSRFRVAAEDRGRVVSRTDARGSVPGAHARRPLDNGEFRWVVSVQAGGPKPVVLNAR